MSDRGPLPGGDVERIVALCAGSGAAPVLQGILGVCEPAIAAAMAGRPLTIEIKARKCRQLRIGITAGGRVACPLDGDDPADVRLGGTADEIAALFVGDLSIDQALRDGVLVIPSGETRLDPIARLRAIVSAQLRALLSGPAAMLALARRTRIRSEAWCRWPAELSAAVDRAVGPALLAAASLLTPIAPQVHLTAADRPAAAVRTSAASPAALSRLNDGHSAPKRLDAGQPGGAHPSEAGSSLHVSWHRDDDSLHAGVQGTTNTPAAQQPSWAEMPVWGQVRCGTTIGGVLCDAAARIPTGS